MPPLSVFRVFVDLPVRYLLSRQWHCFIVPRILGPASREVGDRACIRSGSDGCIYQFSSYPARILSFPSSSQSAAVPFCHLRLGWSVLFLWRSHLVLLYPIPLLLLTAKAPDCLLRVFLVSPDLTSALPLLSALCPVLFLSVSFSETLPLGSSFFAFSLLIVFLYYPYFGNRREDG